MEAWYKQNEVVVSEDSIIHSSHHITSTFEIMILVHQIVMTFVLIFISLGLALPFSTNLYILLYHKIDLLLSGITKTKNAIIQNSCTNLKMYLTIFSMAMWKFTWNLHSTLWQIKGILITGIDKQISPRG